VRVHLAAEHATELEFAHTAFEAADLAFNLLGRTLVVLRLGQLQQFAGVTYRGQRGVEILQLPGELRALASQGLGPLGCTPDSRLLELAADFL
jgi:hypothetical protein